MVEYLHDPAWLSYVIHGLIDFFGVLLMSWWIFMLLRAKKRVSIFYVCILLMFLGGLAYETTNAFSRSFFIQENVAAMHYLQTHWWWPSRVVLNITADAIVAIIMINRYLDFRKNGDD
jgi:hypothetical protein